MKNNIFKTLFLLIAGFISGIIFFITFIIFLLLFTFSFNKQPVPKISNSWLLLDYSGKISEKPVAKGPFSFTLSNKNLYLLDYLNAIENAAYDDRIKGIIINGDLTNYSKVHIEEINNSLMKFKRSGKDIIAWFSQADINNYILCTSADKIYMPDTDSADLTLKGYSQEIPYLKKGLDKLGLDFNVIHIGNYKGTGENLILDSMSNELKESYTSIIKNLNKTNFEQISKARNIEISKLESLVNSGATILMNPDTALKYGFLDNKLSYEELVDSISKNKDFQSISIYNYNELQRKKESKNKIALICADGMITNFYSTSNINQDTIGAKSFIRDLNKFKKAKNVKAVIIRVNSPGGSALASELISQAITDLKKIKPVYVSFGTVAASGGYYISCNADRIFTSPSTITGSIGVVSILMNFEEIYKKYGINYEIIKEYKYDDFLSSARKPFPEELEILKNSMLLTYNEFTDLVMKNRKINNNDISKIAEGRVWTGMQSLDKKLTDQTGGIIDTIEYAAITNKLDSYLVVSYPKPEDFFSRISKMSNIKYNIELLNNKYLKNIIQLSLFCKDNNNKPAYLFPFFDIP